MKELFEDIKELWRTAFVIFIGAVFPVSIVVIIIVYIFFKLLVL